MKHKHEKTRSGMRGLLVISLLFSLFLMSAVDLTAQQKRITGVVNDANGPVSGVAVTVKGTTQGTTTDAQGAYAINATPNSMLEFSFIGYKTQEVPVDNRQRIDVTMEEDATAIDEVVVIGFGTVKKRDLTGSVASIKQDVILKVPTSNPMTAMQGRVAGVDISGDDIRIRGNRSIGGKNEPLFIIDGLQGGSYKDISPNDIESVEVLKDASSTAIYGSQGANGVIIITTKKGRSGKTQISYTGYAGFDFLPTHPDYRQGESYIAPIREAYKTVNMWNSPDDDAALFTNQAAWEAYSNGVWTNYDDLLKQNAFHHSHQVTASGGNDKTTARFSAGYYDQEGQYKGSKTQRYTLRTNVDHKIRNWISAGINIQLTHNVKKNSPYSGGGIKLGSPYDAEGNIVTYPLGESGYVNPLIDNATGSNNVKNVQGTDILSNGYLDFKLFKGLSFRSQLGVDLSFQRTGEFHAAYSTDRLTNGTSSSKMENDNNRYVNWDNIITYQREFGDHNLTVTALSSWTQGKKEGLWGSGTGQLVPTQLYYNLGANLQSSFGVGSSYVQTQTSSYAGRINYGYKGRYLLTLSNRWDGASRLAKGNKWSAFPSAALAWRVSDESFMNSTKSWLDDLKFRVSYGVTGNSGIDPYGTQSGVSPGYNLGFQDMGATYYKFNDFLGNIDLGWEKSATINVGLDFSILKNRINAAIDVYKTKTTDLLLPRSVPTSMGSEGFSMYQNIGETSNKGIEIQLNTVNISTPAFRWTSTLTFTKNKEKIENLIDGKDIIAKEKEEKSLLIGRPIMSYYTFVNQGIWQTSEADLAATYFKDAKKTQPFKPGDIKVADLDGDFVIDEANDVTFIGSNVPKWYAGLNNTFTYKNFDLNIFMFMRRGFITSNPAAGYNPSDGGTYANFNYWTPENPSNDLPRPIKGGRLFDYKGYQSLSYTDGSFFKLKNVSLGYTFPNKMLNSARISNLRIYVTGTNLWSVSKSHFKKGYDAEGQCRQVVVGLNLEF